MFSSKADIIIVEEKAPPGKIRFICREKNTTWLIGDKESNLSHVDIEEIIGANRGPGIDISVYDEDGQTVGSA